MSTFGMFIHFYIYMAGFPKQTSRIFLHGRSSPDMFIMKLYVFGSPMAFILLFTFIHFSAVRFHLPKREPP
jgi:hypothetical protein